MFHWREADGGHESLKGAQPMHVSQDQLERQLISDHQPHGAFNGFKPAQGGELIEQEHGQDRQGQSDQAEPERDRAKGGDRFSHSDPSILQFIYRVRIALL